MFPVLAEHHYLYKLVFKVRQLTEIATMKGKKVRHKRCNTEKETHIIGGAN